MCLPSGIVSNAFEIGVPQPEFFGKQARSRAVYEVVGSNASIVHSNKEALAGTLHFCSGNPSLMKASNSSISGFQVGG